ncbi:MAG TPA: pyridoxal 5'-phosphate synthase glutaminase subunit PdxT [Archaeoglobaceae archaeon]|nr:pyridoxal 5'-phosphate synthase glutaminase subunit PdxT [Archaeoglobaceae archaeon]
MRVSVIGFQGDVEEHVNVLRRAVEKLGINCTILAARKPSEVSRSDAVVIPGGESTTIGRLIFNDKVSDEILKLYENGNPVMGTCAGLILISKYGDEQVEKTRTRLLGLIDARVKRNAFGRQKESFQTNLNIKGIGEYNAVFIRAPAIVEVGNGVDVMARIDDYIVAARQKNVLGLAFHPELTDDTRIHEYFLKMI